ncbi:MAG TPA: phage/plasmid primase, P4 family [Verrucomicrobiae bacterium]|nr:phage/plasmid primase, P4 family [Verrucomicrobiae bacterium]
MLQERLPKITCVGKQWHVWETGVLQPTKKDRFRPMAHEILRRDQESSGLANSVLNTIEGRCQVSEDKFKSFAVMDGDAILLNCRNGILQVTRETVALLPHTMDHLFTKQIAAAFDEQAGLDEFDRVVAEALREEEDRQLFLRFAGYTLLPNCSLHAALICYGQGGTGKSTVWDAIANVLGTDLVMRVSLRQLCDGQGYSIPRLRFAALNLGTEAPSGDLGETDVLKNLVCGEPVEARAIYGKPATFQGYCTKFVFLSNHLPHFKHGTDAELRRLRFLHFAHKPDQVDPRVPQRLAAEKDGIFSHLMVPTLQTLLRDPIIPDGGTTSRAVRERFAIENDPLEAFLTQCCKFGPELQETKDNLHGAFLAWADGKDVAAGLKTAAHFFQELRTKRTGLQDFRPTINGVRTHCLTGICLKDSGDAQK